MSPKLQGGHVNERLPEVMVSAEALHAQMARTRNTPIKTKRLRSAKAKPKPSSNRNAIKRKRMIGSNNLGLGFIGSPLSNRADKRDSSKTCDHSAGPKNRKLSGFQVQAS